MSQPLVWISDNDQMMTHAAKQTGANSFVWRALCEVSFSYPSVQKAEGKPMCGICNEIVKEGYV